jgi:hypothetical protein
MQQAAVQLDMVFFRIGLRTEGSDDFPIHFYPALKDKFFSFSPGSDARL